MSSTELLKRILQVTKADLVVGPEPYKPVPYKPVVSWHARKPRHEISLVKFGCDHEQTTASQGSFVFMTLS